MTIEKMENSAWLGFPKNDPSVTDTVYVPITGGKKNGVYERILLTIVSTYMNKRVPIFFEFFRHVPITF